jgi:two-component system response regulator HydG
MMQLVNPVSLLDRLHESPFLRRVSPSRLDRLASSSTEHRLAPGVAVLTEGEPGTSVLLILRGRVSISKRLDSGENVPVATRGPGEWIGEMALLDHGPRSASATTLDEATLLEVPRATFLEVVLAVPEAALELLRVLSERVRESDRSLIEALTRKAEQLDQHNRSLARENRRLAGAFEERSGFENFLGESAAVRRVRTLARRAAETEFPVLLLGETGTGKDLLARAIHVASERAHEPFVALNCTLLSDALLESELFGHVRGAFTSANTTKAGLVEVANGGTLFLDEIGDLPRSAQGALLRFLEVGEYRRLGDPTTRHADVRLVAATHVDLEAAVEEGSFRRDLLYRLDVVRIDVPPLRDRPEDIPELIAHTNRSTAARIGVEPLAFSRQAEDALTGYAFPGNVRELENEIARLFATARRGERIEIEDLSPRITLAEPRAGATYSDSLRAFKMQLVRRALRDAQGHRAEAARRLGVHPANLVRMMRELGLRESPPPRSAPRARDGA